jgi:hypothetical protein
MQTILKLKSDGAQLLLTLVLLVACVLNVVFVGAYIAATAPGRAQVSVRAALPASPSVRVAAASDLRPRRVITR